MSGQIRSDFPGQVVGDYVLGNCGALALFLNRHFGAKIFGLVERTEGAVPLHYASRFGDYYIDITGARDSTGFIENTLDLLNRADKLGLRPKDTQLVPVSPKDLGNPDYLESMTGAVIAEVEPWAVRIMTLLHDRGVWPSRGGYRNPNIELLASKEDVARDFLLSHSALGELSENLFPAWRYSDGRAVLVKMICSRNVKCETVAEVLGTYALMSRLRVTVPIYSLGLLPYTSDTGFVIMAKADLSFCKLLTEAEGGPEEKALLSAANSKVQLMHDRDIAHGDLHARNIVCVSRLGRGRAPKPYIVDFETSFHISRGATLKVRQWMRTGFDWEGSFADFVNLDFRNWTDECD